MVRQGLVSRWLHRYALRIVATTARRPVLRALRQFTGMLPTERHTFCFAFHLPLRHRIALALIMVLLEQPEKLYWLALALLLFAFTRLQEVLSW